MRSTTLIIILTCTSLILLSTCKKEEKEDTVYSVDITAPLNGESTELGDTLVVRGTVFEKSGFSKVELFIDNEMKQSFSEKMFEYQWITTDVELGEHKIKAIAYDTDGNSETDQITVEIVDQVPNPDFTAVSTSILASQTVTFTDETTSDPTAWFWDFGDGYTSEEQNPTHVYLIAGTYDVTLQVGNEFGSMEVTKEDYINVMGHTIDMETIYVQGGSFEMGCSNSDLYDCEPDEYPIHTVTLDDYYISKYEITNQQFAFFLNDIGAESDGFYNEIEYIEMDDLECQIVYEANHFVPITGYENYPVVEITWFGAYVFCGYYGGSLPTEAQWEYAAKGGNNGSNNLFAGSDVLTDVAWCSSNSFDHSHEIGQKDPNELGIYDMTGNASEWCLDNYDASYYSVSPELNPQGPEPQIHKMLKIRRGGSFGVNAQYSRNSFRRQYNRYDSNRFTGFRFVKAAE